MVENNGYNNDNEAPMLSSMMESKSAERQGSASFGKATVGGQFRRLILRARLDCAARRQFHDALAVLELL